MNTPNTRNRHITQNVTDAMVATTVGAFRDRPYVDQLLFRLRELLLHRLQAFRISGAFMVFVVRTLYVCVL